MPPPAFLKSVANVISGDLTFPTIPNRDLRVMFLTFVWLLNSDVRNLLGDWSGRRGSNPQLPAWEAKFPLLYFHNLQNRLGKINVHATHTVHALPDLRVAGG